MKKVTILLLSLLLIGHSNAQTLPRIIILATGGTIAGQGANVDRAGYTPGKVSVDDLLSTIPTIKKKADIKGEQIAAVGSYDITIEIWLRLAKRINEIFAKNEADGIVITHGTDTQEETAYFLQLTVTSEKPVVLTGSMRPGTAISADGPKNLYDAIIVAANPQSIGKGVMISFNENIYDAKNVVKTNTTHLNAFESPNSGPIGQVFDGKVIFYSQPIKKKLSGVPFNISQLNHLPVVEIIPIYVNASPLAIHALVNDTTTAGIIIAGTGNGSINKSILNEVKNAIKKNIQVVRSSRVVAGRVTEDEVVINDRQLGTIVSDNLNPQKARILLMLALTVTKDRDRLQEIFFNQ